ncbi:MAG: zinc-ribbon domain-containing protein [Deltaproteobacteria bacterium]|nr:zinc-ribbon domain-containing protein [Deltaproteobacteria bacterium]
MKIVCDACQAKYSISDDKVQGKVFKIRCKKCSNIIVVRGGAGAAEPAPAPTQEKETRVYDYGYEGGDQPPAGDDAVWHVVINQDQVGPMTAAEVQQRFTGGEIDAETYIWREGFADWLPIAQVDTFAGFVASGTTTTASPGGGADAVGGMFSGLGGGGDEGGTVRSDPGDLFATASASARHSDDDGDLFGSKPSSSSSSAASASANSKLRGERNENSVLFSLGNLAQLASDRPAPSSSSSSSSSSSGGAGHATGAAGGEGSGLIDIRSMANAYLGGSGGAAKPTVSSAIGSIDDLPVFGGGGFSEPAVIVPTSSRQNNSKLMYALIGSVGLLAVAAVILVVVMLRGDKDKGTQVASNSATDAKTGAVDPAASDKPDETTAAVADGSAAAGMGSDGSAAVVAVPPTDKPAEPLPVEKSVEKPADKKSSSRRDSKQTQTAKVDKTVKEPTPPKEASSSGGCDEVSCVLNNYEGACCAKYKKGGSKTATTTKTSGGGGDLPDSLDRTMISEGVGKVKARVMSCGEKSSAKGQVKVSIKVSPDGSVSSASVKATPDPGLGSCVASAMQKASFKKTQNGGSFSYPFVF